MYKDIAIILLPVFWPNLPPLGLAALKGYLVKQDVKVEATIAPYSNAAQANSSHVSIYHFLQGLKTKK